MAVPLDHEIRFCSLEREIWPWQRTRLTKVQGLLAFKSFRNKILFILRRENFLSDFLH